MGKKDVKIRVTKYNKIYLDFYISNKRYKEYLSLEFNEKNKKIAQYISDKLEFAIKSNNLNAVMYKELFPDSKKIYEIFNIQPETDIPSFGDFFNNEFIKYQRKRYEIGEISESHYKNFIKNFKNITLEIKNKKINEILPKDLENFKFFRKKSGKKAKTINNELATISAVLKYAKENKYISDNEIPEIKTVSKKSESEYINPFNGDEIYNILEFLKNRQPTYYLMFLFATFTGVRPEELLGIEWKHINLKEHTCQIKQVIVNHKVKNLTKNKYSERVIQLTKPIVEELLKINVDEREGFLFKNQYGNYFTSCQSVNKYGIKSACNHLNIEYRPIKQCRHTFAIQSLRAYERPDKIARQMGHKDLNMLFSVYGKFIKNDFSEPLKIENLFYSIKFQKCP